MPELLRLVLRTVVAAIRSRRDLVVENLILRHHLQVALRTNPHPRLRASDGVLQVWLSERMFTGGNVLVALGKP